LDCSKGILISKHSRYSKKIQQNKVLKLKNWIRKIVDAFSSKIFHQAYNRQSKRTVLTTHVAVLEGVTQKLIFVWGKNSLNIK